MRRETLFRLLRQAVQAERDHPADRRAAGESAIVQAVYYSALLGAVPSLAPLVAWATELTPTPVSHAERMRALKRLALTRWVKRREQTKRLLDVGDELERNAAYDAIATAVARKAAQLYPGEKGLAGRVRAALDKEATRGRVEASRSPDERATIMVNAAITAIRMDIDWDYEVTGKSGSRARNPAAALPNDALSAAIAAWNPVEPEPARQVHMVLAGLREARQRTEERPLRSGRHRAQQILSSLGVFGTLGADVTRTRNVVLLVLANLRALGRWDRDVVAEAMAEFMPIGFGNLRKARSKEDVRAQIVSAVPPVVENECDWVANVLKAFRAACTAIGMHNGPQLIQAVRRQLLDV